MKTPFRIIKLSFVLALPLGTVFFIWAYFYEPNTLIVQNYEIKIANWNPKLSGFKIVAISDIHGGSNNVTEAKIREVVAQANAQNADLIVLLGDYVSQNFYNRSELKMPIATIGKNLQGLQAKYGVFAIIGNHDIWNDQPAIKNALQSNGYKVLEDEVITIDVNGEKLSILGLMEILKVRLPWKEYSAKLNEILKNSNADKNLLVLTHTPDQFASFLPTESRLDFMLMIAGHTHGGQINLPIVGTPVVPSSYGQKYAKGEIAENGKHLFVTSGIGTSILPFRFRVPPEISVLTIKSE